MEQSIETDKVENSSYAKNMKYSYETIKKDR